MRFGIILSCVLFVFLGACSTFKFSQRTPASVKYVDPEYQQFQYLISEALSFRAEALKFAHAKKLDGGQSVSLTRDEGEYVRKVGAHYLEIRKKLLDYAVREAKTFEVNNQAILNPYKGTQTKTEFKGDKAAMTYYTFLASYIDPTDAEGAKRLFKMQMGLTAALLLMDNYLVAIQPYNENASLRYVLNYDTDQYRALQEIADSYSYPAYRDQLTAAIRFVDQVMAWRRSQGINTSDEESRLYEMTQSSIWYLAVRNGKTSSGTYDTLANLWNRLTLRGKRGARVVTYGVSMGFGNLVGLVETRKGYLYNMESAEKEALIRDLKPLDVLLEKTPFRLTDKMIPGHYGHVAIWLGTEEQLKEIHAWDQLPKAIQEKVRSGHHIVEALRPGVQINTLEHFLNIDDFLVLRDTRPEVTDAYRRHAILQAAAQVGKEYDFNFDVHTHERIVCSEIAYVVFSDIKWPLEETVRRYTISPDNVAQMAVGSKRIFEPVMMYYDGKRIRKDLPHSLTLLLKADDAAYAEFAKFQNL